MFTRHGSRNLNIWAPLASLALVALFATPALLRASFEGLVGGSAALFVLVTVLSLISGSREGLTTFSLLPSASQSGPKLGAKVCREYVLTAEDRILGSWHGRAHGSLAEFTRVAGQRA